MILFLDTEFASLDLPSPPLISIALVREDGEYLYAEMPPATYSQYASHFVREAVLPLLWGGSYRMTPVEMGERLQAFIAAIDEPAVIVCDSPDFDFNLLKPLLQPWPSNLSPQPLLFDSYSMGVDRQAWLRAEMDQYHEAGFPVHHALHDAMALRQGMMAARAAGWEPRWLSDHLRHKTPDID